jgi:hypothetical protein
MGRYLIYYRKGSQSTKCDEFILAYELFGGVKEHLIFYKAKYHKKNQYCKNELIKVENVFIILKTQKIH